MGDYYLIKVVNARNASKFLKRKSLYIRMQSCENLNNFNFDRLLQQQQQQPSQTNNKMILSFYIHACVCLSVILIKKITEQN